MGLITYLYGDSKKTYNHEFIPYVFVFVFGYLMAIRIRSWRTLRQTQKFQAFQRESSDGITWLRRFEALENVDRNGMVMNRDVFFKIKLKIFLDTLIVKKYFFIIKINNFRGDLSDISAKTATLVMKCMHCKLTIKGSTPRLPCFCFPNRIKYFLDTLNQKIVF